MHNALFLKNKITRQIKYNGKKYSFKIMCENEYHELAECKEICLSGLYHEKNSYQTENRVDSAITHSKSQPMIMCLLEDAQDLLTGSETFINDKKYKVVSINDVQNLGIVADISLEEEI